MARMKEGAKREQDVEEETQLPVPKDAQRNMGNELESIGRRYTMKLEKQQIKLIVIGTGVTFMLLGYIFFFHAFITAYERDSKKVTIDINKYNEANAELVVLCIITPLVFAAYYLVVKDLFHASAAPPEG